MSNYHVEPAAKPGAITKEAIKALEDSVASPKVDIEWFKMVCERLSRVDEAGGTKALVFQLASLTDVHWSMSGEVVLMTLLGGLGTVFGPVVGAFVIIAMQQYLAGFGQWVTVIQGAIFVICVLTFRRGVIGEIAHYFKRSL